MLRNNTQCDCFVTNHNGTRDGELKEVRRLQEEIDEKRRGLGLKCFITKNRSVNVNPILTSFREISIEL